MMPSEGEGVYFVGAVHSVVSPKGDAHLEPFKPPEVFVSPACYCPNRFSSVLAPWDS